MLFYHFSTNFISSDQRNSKLYFAGEKSYHAITRLNFDLAYQNSIFLNNCDMIFEIKPQNNTFLFLGPRYPKVTNVAKKFKAIKILKKRFEIILEQNSE